MGYKKVDGEIVLDDAEAAIVRKIYDYFLAGYGYSVIADRLTAEGVPTKKPGSMWASTTVRMILLNEKYCGNCLFQRTFIEDPISKKVIFNRGQLPQYLVEDALPVIIPKDEWQAAQELMNRHEMHQRGQSEDQPFVNILHCPYCGKKYRFYYSGTYNQEVTVCYRCHSIKTHTAAEIPGMMFTPPPRWRIEHPSDKMIAYREKYHKPKPARQMLCTDIRIPINQPEKRFVTAWNQLVSKKARYQPALRRTVDSTDNPLTRYRAKEMIGLLDTVGRLKEFDFPLMLRTLDYVEVQADSKLSFVFQSGIRMTV